MDYHDALTRVLDDVVAPNADAIDRSGDYPRANLRALGEAGILGLVSAADVGGGGEGLGAAADVVGRLAQHCGSTAMIVMMHYSATAVLEAHGSTTVRSAIAAGNHLTTLAFSEAGSRSHFWAPRRPRRPSTATASASTPTRAGSPRPARPTATSGRAGRSTRRAR